jgi:malate dehydrogenase (oxaloacetate-decarboxylating)
MNDYSTEALALHTKLRGKISIENKMELNTTHDLTLVYSPGVAAPCKAIHKMPSLVWDLTIKSNTVAVITDGSAVLGLGNIGARASIPVMEGKAMLFKEFGGINAIPLALDTQNTEEIIRTIQILSPILGGVNLEDIASPRCFEIEDRLQNLGIPVFHDDQHGTAVVVLAAIYNACKLLGKDIHKLKVVINGAGAAGIATAKLLKDAEFTPGKREPIHEVIICDRRGIIHKQREDLNSIKQELLDFVNINNQKGTLRDALEGADVFIGLSEGNLLTSEDIKRMNKDCIVLALANPTPEILPEDAYAGGAAVVGTGRSDYPNQVNNVLAFPGIFKGALEARATRITPLMKLQASRAIAESVTDLSFNKVIPSSLDKSVALRVAEAVKKAWMSEYENLVY